ncbi:MAG: hypothetical protein ACFFAN_00870 [Promethearchaeota archaeon]
MEKPTSYYDWELMLRKKNKISNIQQNRNSLGITNEEFKKFLKNWKIKNLHSYK